MKIDELVPMLIPSKAQRKFLILCALGWIAVAAGVMLIPFTLPAIITQWNLSAMEAGTLASATFMGMLLGALISGIVADLTGRKYANLIFLFLTSIVTALNGFAGSPKSFTILRFISGIGYGGLLPSVNAYLSELTSIKLRGRYLVYLETSWAIGSILIGLFAVTVGARWGWRSVYHVMAVFGLLIIPFALAPESPKYLFLKGGVSALEKQFKVKIEHEIEPVKRVSVPFTSLFSKEYRNLTIMVWVSWFVVSFVYYGIFIWLPKVFANKGIGEVRSMWFTFLMMVAQLPGYLSVAYLIERTGRKLTLAVYFFGTAVSTLIFAWATNLTVFVIAALVTSFFCLGVWGLVYAYTPELFPTAFRGTANGMAGVMARIAGIIAPYFTGYFLKNKAVIDALIWFAVLSVIAGLVVLLLGVETKGKAVE